MHFLCYFLFIVETAKYVTPWMCNKTVWKSDRIKSIYIGKGDNKKILDFEFWQNWLASEVLTSGNNPRTSIITSILQYNRSLISELIQGAETELVSFLLMDWKKSSKTLHIQRQQIAHLRPSFSIAYKRNFCARETACSRINTIYFNVRKIFLM